MLHNYLYAEIDICLTFTGRESYNDAETKLYFEALNTMKNNELYE